MTDEDNLSPEEAGHLARPRGSVPFKQIEDEASAILQDYPGLPPDELFILLGQLRLMPTYYQSEPRLEPGKWSVPKDLPAWKVTRQKLLHFEKALDKAYVILRDGIETDPSFRAALEQSTPDGHFENHYIAFLFLIGITQKAVDIEGSPGNRPLPPWTSNAAKLCTLFWQAHCGEPANGNFTYDGQTMPANAFSKWFCRVMKGVDAGLTPSACDTILRSNRAKSSTD